MNNRFIFALLIAFVFAVIPANANTCVTITGNFSDEGEILIPLVYEGSGSNRNPDGSLLPSRRNDS